MPKDCKSIAIRPYTLCINFIEPLISMSLLMNMIRHIEVVFNRTIFRDGSRLRLPMFQRKGRDIRKDPVNYSIRKARSIHYMACAPRSRLRILCRTMKTEHMTLSRNGSDESYQYMKEKYEEWCSQYHNVMLYTGIWCTFTCQKAL